MEGGAGLSATVAQIHALIDSIAPFDLAESWDNTGLLMGQWDARVDMVLCALDMNRSVLDEAIQKGARLVVTHHPILFGGRKNLCETDAEGRLLCGMVRARISMIAAHTNYDNASPGVNDALAAVIGLEHVEKLDMGVRLGVVTPMRFGILAADVSEKLGGPVRRYGEESRIVTRVAVLGGAGEDYAGIAHQAQADVFLTGEMAYHKALNAMENGMCVLEAGHAATERPGMEALCGALQIAADALQYNVCFMCSESELYL